MRRIFFAAGSAALIAAGSASAEPETYTVDPRHTFPTYEVNHNGYSVQRGRFNKTSGRVTIDIAAKKGAVEIAMETASVSSGIDKLDELLRGEDFFNAAKFPVITFKSNNLSFEGERLKSLSGDLTIKGVTRPVTFTVSLFHCAPNPLTKTKTCGGDIATTIKRSDFGVMYALPNLADDVTLRIGVEGIKEG